MAKTNIPVTQLYMVIDVTTVEETKIRYVAPVKEATLLGQLYMAEHPGRKVIAPPLEGRGFSKVDSVLQLQYLFWNTFQKTPPEDYSELLQACLNEATAFEVSEVDIPSLQGELAALGGTTTKAPGEKKERKVKAEGEVTVPKKTSTCGLVWDICDKYLASTGLAIDDKTLRTAIMAACENEGINKSTAAVQFGKWKASKNPIT